MALIPDPLHPLYYIINTMMVATRSTSLAWLISIQRHIVNNRYIHIYILYYIIHSNAVTSSGRDNYVLRTMWS